MGKEAFTKDGKDGLQHHKTHGGNPNQLEEVEVSFVPGHM